MALIQDRQIFIFFISLSFFFIDLEFEESDDAITSCDHNFWYKLYIFVQIHYK